MTLFQEKSDTNSITPSATVYLVGAGPGDEGLITLQGVDALKQADVVIYDALCNVALLDHAPAEARRIYVGKRGGDHTLTQDQINDLLVEQAHAGSTVVRLKGGDPYLFGRGAEEVAYLARRQVHAVVIPGITAGIAVPMMGGIPVTHRKIASTVTFVTGHEDPTKEVSSVDFQSLAGLIKTGGTVCFYMGIGRLGLICQVLTKAGLNPQTPVAVVQWGTTPRQRTLRTTLAAAVADLQQAKMGSPAIILVGQVAGVREPGLDFFTRRPLFGQTIVITRTRQQASTFRKQLQALGAYVLEAPTIEIVPPENWDAVDQAIRTLSDFDWLILTSVNGVEALARRIRVLGLDARHLASVKIAAIGSATAEALEQHLSLRADLVPTRFVAESLAGELIATHDIAKQKMLLLRADIARPALPRLLQQAGAQVTELVVYRTKQADALPTPVIETLEKKQVDWVTFTSSSTARNMVRMLDAQRHLLEHVRLASIGPITSQTLQQLNLNVDLEASQSDIPGLVKALVQHVAKVAV